MTGSRMEVGGRNVVSIAIDFVFEKEKGEGGNNGITKLFDFNLNSWKSKHT
jgi:hypothetical protein